jgi:hypothetical protein
MEIKRGYYKTLDNSLAFIVGSIPEHIEVNGSYIGYVRPVGVDGFDSDWLAICPIRWNDEGKSTGKEAGYNLVEYVGDTEVKVLPKPRKKRRSKYAGNNAE